MSFNSTWLIMGCFFALFYFHRIIYIQKVRKEQERLNRKVSNDNILLALLRNNFSNEPNVEECDATAAQ